METIETEVIKPSPYADKYGVLFGYESGYWSIHITLFDTEGEAHNEIINAKHNYPGVATARIIKIPNLPTDIKGE